MLTLFSSDNKNLLQSGQGVAEHHGKRYTEDDTGQYGEHSRYTWK